MDSRCSTKTNNLNHAPLLLVSRLTQTFSSILFFGLVSLQATAAVPGLPLTEDFSTSELKDGTNTKANWSTEEQAVYLAWKSQQNLDFGTTGTNIGTENENTTNIIFGDIDNDGDLDLIVSNHLTLDNRLYLNDGNGVFPATGTLLGTPSDFTSSLALGDLDGDGFLDLVFGNFGVNRIYFNDQFGSFFPFSTDIGTESDQTYSIKLVDVDNNGSLDVIVGSLGTTNKVYLNDGFAGFPSTGTDIGTETDTTVSLSVVDIDKDGDLDVLAGNYAEVNKLYLNDGKGSFSATGIFLGIEADATYSLITGDVDNDGDFDVLTGNDNQFNKLYINDGFGSFPLTGTPIGTETDFTHDLNLADIDNDGDLDLFTANSLQTNKLYFNLGGATFSTTGIDIGIDTDATIRILTADIDNDGDLDVVVGNSNNTNKIYYQSGAEGISNDQIEIDLDFEQTRAIVLGDIDNDGDIDLISGDYGSTNKLYLNDGKGNFPLFGDPIGGFVPDSSEDLKLADIDGDGDLDLLVANDSGTNQYFNNLGGGNFSSVGYDISPDTNQTYSLAVGDVDKDGDLDVIAGNVAAQNVLYLNDGFGSFSFGMPVGSEFDLTQTVLLVDFDNDGSLDLFVGNSGQTNKFYLNDGLGNFPSIGTDIGGADPDFTRVLKVGDVNNDGLLDVVAGNDGANKLYLSFAGTFPDSGFPIGIETDRTEGLALADIDGDGDLDVLAGNVRSTESNKLYLNNGDGWFPDIGRPVNTPTLNTLTVEVADVDGDGGLDVINGTSTGGNTLYFNKATGGFSSASSIVGNETDASQVVEVGDVDNDGDNDIIVGNIGDVNKLYLNTGNGSFNATGLAIGTIPFDTEDLVLADVDNDGDLDLIVANSGQPNELFINAGGGNYPTTGINLGDEADFTRALLVADINNDGFVDVIAGNNGQVNRIYLNDGFGGFPPVGTAIGTDSDITFSLVLIDIDHDGKPELITGNYGQVNKYYLNIGGGFSSFGSPINGDTNSTFSLVAGDMDNDGDLDLVEGIFGSPNKLYLNEMGPGLSPIGADIGIEPGTTTAIILNDIDHDGDLDVISSNFAQPNLLHLGNGAGLFTSIGANVSNDFSETRNIKLADMNGDGGLDIIAANDGSNNTLTFFNTVKYQTHASTVQSLKINNTETNITTVKLLATETTNTSTTRNTKINYYLSNNDGIKWHQVIPGKNFTFPDAGLDILRWKAELHSLSPSISPVLSQINIVLSTATDTDADGMTDVWELQFALDPQDPLDAALDFDGDGLTNLEEFNASTDPWNFDTDGDFVSDGDEVNLNGTDPNNQDTDSDGLPDGYEVMNFLDPLNAADALTDYDGDGLSNIQEYQLGTSAIVLDSDADGINDGDEVNQGLNPTDKDTDDDGLVDGSEPLLGLDPLMRDTDSDGVLDGFEYGNIIRVNPQQGYSIPGSNRTTGAALSADGRYVAFVSESTNLVSNDTNGVMDVFWSDTLTGEVRRVSVSSVGEEGNDWSGLIVNGYGFDISDNGQFVVFHSNASNLVANDTNNTSDIFLYDIQTSMTNMISVNTIGIQANSGSWFPSISGDGRYVAFDSNAQNLLEGADGNASTDNDVFVHDRQTGTTTLVSKNSTGIQGNHRSNNAVISGNGRFVVFNSEADNLVTGDTNGAVSQSSGKDVFVHDLQTGVTQRISISTDGVQGDNYSEAASISADGRYIAFHSLAKTLDVNVPASYNVFVHDRTLATTERIAIDEFEGATFNFQMSPSISMSGRYIALRASYVTGGTGGAVFVYDRLTAVTRLASQNNDELSVQRNIGNDLALSADGKYIVFSTPGSNMVPDKLDATEEVFMAKTGFTAELLTVPTAVITSVDTAYINTPVLFDASLSVDPNGDPLSYNWDFGDGTFGSGVNVSHTYTTSGTHTVSLDVLDGNSPPSNVTKVINILIDSDADGIDDSADNCPVGESGWTSNGTTDFDSDGCRDATEDLDDDSDSLFDTFEITNGLNPLDATGINGAEGDADGDGFTNIEEQTAGSDASAATGSTSNAGTFNFSSAAISVNEDAGTGSLAVTRTGGSVGAVSVLCFSTDIDTTADVDYTTVNSLLEWVGGDATDKACTFTITPDSDIEGNETFQLDLSNPTGGAKLGAP